MKKKLLLMPCLFLLLSMISVAQNIDGYKVSYVTYSLDGIYYTFVKSGYENNPEWVQYATTGEVHVFKQISVGYGSIVLQDPVQSKVYLIDLKSNELISAPYNNLRRKIANVSNLIEGPELPSENQVYFFKIQNSGKYISLPENNQQNGALATQNRDDSSPSQRFTINYAGSGKYNFLTKLSNGKKALDLYGGHSADGTNIIQWDFHNAPNQQFILWPMNKTSYSIITMHNKFFGIDGGIVNTKDGALIQQMSSFRSDGLQFELVEHKESSPVYRLGSGN